jgi:hypothetical protein
MTEFTREHGVYSGAAWQPEPDVRPKPAPKAYFCGPNPRDIPGVCIPWDEKARELPPISGDPELARRIWENIDALGNMYIWQCLLSF